MSLDFSLINFGDPSGKFKKIINDNFTKIKETLDEIQSAFFNVYEKISTDDWIEQESKFYYDINLDSYSITADKIKYNQPIFYFNNERIYCDYSFLEKEVTNDKSFTYLRIISPIKLNELEVYLEVN